VDLVHGWWTTARSLSPLWTRGDGDRRVPGCGGALTRVGPSATSKHRSSPAGVENGGWSMVVPLRASLVLERWYGCRATAMKRWQRINLVAAALKLRERGKREGDGCGENRRGSPLLGAEGRWGRQWPSDNGRLEGD
jgi:hypothetical protein